MTGITGIAGITGITEFTENPKNINYPVTDNFKSRDASASKNGCLLPHSSPCTYLLIIRVQFDNFTTPLETFR